MTSPAVTPESSNTPGEAPTPEEASASEEAPTTDMTSAPEDAPTAQAASAPEAASKPEDAPTAEATPVHEEASKPEDAPPAEPTPAHEEASTTEASPAPAEASVPEEAPATEGTSAPEEAPAPDPRIERLQQARDSGEEISGRVIGWNRGGFHVAVDGLTAFCPRSEMEPGRPRAPQSYVDRELAFQVLNVRNRGKRIVLSRKAIVERERRERRSEALAGIEEGATVTGRVVSLTDFGAFIDLGGVQGLLHKSEISHRPTEDPAEVLTVGDEVTVQVLRIEQDGARIGLSMRALEPDPWDEVAARFPEGEVVEGTVVRTERPGAFIELAPGVTGLLPTSAMALPADTTAARAYPPGKRVRVQVLRVEVRRRRIGLVREGAQLGGSEADYRAYTRRQEKDEGGFTPLAAALQRLRAEDSE